MSLRIPHSKKVYDDKFVDWLISGVPTGTSLVIEYDHEGEHMMVAMCENGGILHTEEVAE